jgi:hypothetical protein
MRVLDLGSGADDRYLSWTEAYLGKTFWQTDKTEVIIGPEMTLCVHGSWGPLPIVSISRWNCVRKFECLMREGLSFPIGPQDGAVRQRAPPPQLPKLATKRSSFRQDRSIDQSLLQRALVLPAYWTLLDVKFTMIRSGEVAQAMTLLHHQVLVRRTL